MKYGDSFLTPFSQYFFHDQRSFLAYQSEIYEWKCQRCRLHCIWQPKHELNVSIRLFFSAISLVWWPASFSATILEMISCVSWARRGMTPHAMEDYPENKNKELRKTQSAYFLFLRRGKHCLYSLRFKSDAKLSCHLSSFIKMKFGITLDANENLIMGWTGFSAQTSSWLIYFKLAHIYHK